VVGSIVKLGKQKSFLRRQESIGELNESNLSSIALHHGNRIGRHKVAIDAARNSSPGQDLSSGVGPRRSNQHLE
jgi:hypothetical protein